MSLTIFAERLKQAREACSLKQNELAKIVGVTPATISAYENSDGGKNGKKPTLENAQNIASALGVSLDWLCGLNEINLKKEPKAIGIFEALMFIMCNIKNTSISFDELPKPCAKLQFFDVNIYSFIKEYTQIDNFLKDTRYSDYLKNSLKKAITEKYKDYILRDGYIFKSENEYLKQCSNIGTLLDVDELNAPLDDFDTPF